MYAKVIRVTQDQQVLVVQDFRVLVLHALPTVCKFLLQGTFSHHVSTEESGVEEKSFHGSSLDLF
jgi:hypothetical protein